ncbi:MAG TPA: hypothetical protein VGI48_03530 [Caldimonas sp.]|jgi:hypothetical protein
MNTQRERPPFSTIAGTSVRLSERESIAIYRWDDLSWVAHFRDGCGELSDAATWYRAHGGLLRSRWVGTPDALERVEILTPEMVARIARLHQRVAAEQARRDAAAAASAAALRRMCARMVAALRGWSVRLLRRAG